MRQVVLNYLRIFRTQTYPASLCLVMVALLAPNSVFNLWLVAMLFPLVWLLHGIGFGLNSYLDTIAGFDRRDRSKKGHPLVSGKISMNQACRVLNWGACLTAVLGVLVALYAQNPTLALAAFLIYIVFGYSYDCGLSKVDPLSFISISVSFTAFGAWAWFLSHPSIGLIGIILLAYIFTTIWFQVGFSGFVKEMGVRERSNLLIRLGARLGGFMVSKKQGGREYFVPGNSIYYGYGIKLTNLFLGGFLLYLVFSWQGLVSLLLFGSVALYFLHQLTKHRVYERDRELLNMSCMEISTIFMPILIVVPLVPSLVLMIFSVAYFWICNKALWGVALHPRV